MRILFVITGLHIGGAERMLVELVCGLKELGNECLIVNLKNPGSIQQKLDSKNINVISLNINSLSSLNLGIKKLKQEIINFKPNLIQGWMYHANLFSQFVNWSLGSQIPLVWGIRYALIYLSSDKCSTRFLIWLSGIFSRRPSAIIYNSLTSQTSHEKQGYSNENSGVIFNGVDLNNWKPDESASQQLKKELGVSSEAFVIGMVCRYDPVKDIPTFLKAASLLSSNNSKVHFVLVGPGMEQNNTELVGTINSLNLPKRISLLGEREDLPYINAGLDVATLTSKSESFPNSILEAMACGTPCVVSDVGDCRSLVNPCGLVFNVGEATDLVSQWNIILNESLDIRKNRSAAAREKVSREYDLNSMVKKYSDLYHQLAQA